jgi:hypothetical protein
MAPIEIGFFVRVKRVELRLGPSDIQLYKVQQIPLLPQRA